MRVIALIVLAFAAAACGPSHAPAGGTWEPADAGADGGADAATACVPESDLTTCRRLGLCGIVDVLDNCGVAIRTYCGPCCDGGGICPGDHCDLDAGFGCAEGQYCDGYSCNLCSDTNPAGCGQACTACPDTAPYCSGGQCLPCRPLGDDTCGSVPCCFGTECYAVDLPDGGNAIRPDGGQLYECQPVGG